MKGVINQAVKLYLAHRMRRIEQYSKKPESFQSYWLEKLLRSAEKTSFGRQYGFHEIKNHESFAARLPVIEYETAKGYIDRMMHGEEDVLWPGRTDWFSKSSGTTTTQSKFIPVSRANLYGCHVAGSWDSLALLYDNKPEMEVFKRKNLILPGSFQHFAPNPRTKYGDVSAILIHNMPAIGRSFYTPDFEVALQQDFEQKIHQTADIASKQEDIVMFGGVPTWLLVLFRLILEKTGKSNLLEVWPHLQAYMHGGVGFGPYRDTFRQLIPSDDFAYQEIYNASEGYFGAQSDLKSDDLLLFLDNGIYYEFIPMEEWGEAHPRAIPLWEVELGKNYALVISTNGGLWRYMPGDTLQFTSSYPYKFKITGRTKQFINAFGEELMVADAEKALSIVCKKTGAIVRDYTVAPVFQEYGRKGKHEWVVEFEHAPANLHTFALELDNAIKSINSDYEAKRFKDMALSMLMIREVPKGTFHAWLRYQGRFGGQSKVPRLCNSREHIEKLNAFLVTL